MKERRFFKPHVLEPRGIGRADCRNCGQIIFDLDEPGECHYNARAVLPFRNELFSQCNKLYETGRVTDERLGCVLEGLANVLCDITDGYFGEDEHGRIAAAVKDAVERNWRRRRGDG